MPFPEDINPKDGYDDYVATQRDAVHNNEPPK
jgi:hypothetical protein